MLPAQTSQVRRGVLTGVRPVVEVMFISPPLEQACIPAVKDLLPAIKRLMECA